MVLVYIGVDLHLPQDVLILIVDLDEALHLAFYLSDFFFNSLFLIAAGQWYELLQLNVFWVDAGVDDLLPQGLVGG